MSARFQSTLPRRERRYEIVKSHYEDGDFNPHSHEGSDIFGRILIRCCNFISIHTPTKGATEVQRLGVQHLRNSIHTPTKGATRAHWINLFLHTYFNPHSHEGSDASSSVIVCTPFSFQSTLPRRERRRMYDIILLSREFQSTLPRRERHKLYAFSFIEYLFQSTLPRRERHFYYIVSDDLNIFQSTLPRRERHFVVL